MMIILDPNNLNSVPKQTMQLELPRGSESTLFPRCLPSVFSCLRLYPNKALLSKCKPTAFKTSTCMFEDRCVLFTELCYLLLKNYQSSDTFYLSKHMYTNHSKSLFMFYSMEEKYKDRFSSVNSIHLAKNVVDLYERVFPKGQGGQMQGYIEEEKLSQTHAMCDFEYQSIIENSLQLMGSFLALIPQIEEGPNDKEGQVQILEEWTQQESDVVSGQLVLAKLQASKLFQDFSYPFKWNKAVLIRSLTHPQEGKKNEIVHTYSELLDMQFNFQRLITPSTSTAALTGISLLFHDRLYHFFKLLQADNYLKITSSDEQPKQKDTPKTVLIFTIDFSSNLKKLNQLNYTHKENSQSSHYNEEESDNIPNQLKEFNQSLHAAKSQIMFKISIRYQQQNQSFQLAVEGQSQWIMEEFYYQQFGKLWHLFINDWYSEAIEGQEEGREEGMEEGRGKRLFRGQLDTKHKTPVLKELFQLKPSANITKEILVAVDRIVMLFMLFEKTLKSLFKGCQNMLDHEELHLDYLQNPEYAEPLVQSFRQALKDYELYEKAVARIERQFLQK